MGTESPWDRFAETVLVFGGDEPVEVHVHAGLGPSVRARLASLGLGECFAVITPCNPLGVTVEDRANEERLIANPSIIEKLYLNKHTRMSTADRLIELQDLNSLRVATLQLQQQNKVGQHEQAVYFFPAKMAMNPRCWPGTNGAGWLFRCSPCCGTVSGKRYAR